MDFSNERLRAELYKSHVIDKDYMRLAGENFENIISEVEDYAIFLLDPKGIILSWNKGAEKIKGYKPTEIIGKSYQLFYSAEDLQNNLPQTLLEQARVNGKVVHEGWRVKKDGHRFWGNITITAIHDADGNVAAFLKLTKDLTEKKLAEDRYNNLLEELRLKNAELKREEERYHNMVSEVQDYAILLLNSNGDIQNWNAGAEIIKGYKAEEIIGKSFKSFYTQEDIKSGLPERLLNAAREYGRASNEGWRKRKDGSTFWASVVITALHNETGAVIGFTKVTRDLTERKNYEDRILNNAVELAFKNQELENLNAELSSFAYIVSHDLKEPVRKMRIFANRQLEPGMSAEDIKMYSNKILASAVHMHALMEGVLLFSRISNEHLDQEEVDLNEILNSVISDLEFPIQEHKVKITKDQLPVITGIKYQLHQLFLNLLSNAIKFAKPDVPPEISITCSVATGNSLPQKLPADHRSYYQITVTDNGIGFEQKQQEKIFDVFKRLKQKKEASGTGIGLSIVKKVTINHCGYVTATSKPNEGAQFHVFLPATNR